MLYWPILCGRIDKWAYTLIEYDLTFELLKTLKGQVLADFIFEHVLIWMMKSITLLLLHGNFILMDRFVKMAKVLVLFLFLPMVLKLECQAD
jgi:hypothetical protein